MTPRERTLVLLPMSRLLVLQRLTRASDPTTGRIGREALDRERRSFPELLRALADDGWIEATADGRGCRLADDPDPSSDPFAFPKALPTYPPPLSTSTKGAPECAPSPSPRTAPR